MIAVTAAKFAGQVTILASKAAEMKQLKERRRGQKKPCAFCRRRESHKADEEANVDWIPSKPVNAFDDDGRSRLVGLGCVLFLRNSRIAPLIMPATANQAIARIGSAALRIPLQYTIAIAVVAER